MKDNAPAGLALGSYEELASEYYDPLRHPTCANFREASALILKKWVMAHPGQFRWEVGAGDSVLAELLSESAPGTKGVVIADASLSMLKYSSRWTTQGALLVVSRAESLPVTDGHVD